MCPVHFKRVQPWPVFLLATAQVRASVWVFPTCGRPLPHSSWLAQTTCAAFVPSSPFCAGITSCLRRPPLAACGPLTPSFTQSCLCAPRPARAPPHSHSILPRHASVPPSPCLRRPSAARAKSPRWGWCAGQGAVRRGGGPWGRAAGAAAAARHQGHPAAHAGAAAQLQVGHRGVPLCARCVRALLCRMCARARCFEMCGWQGVCVARLPLGHDSSCTHER